MTIVINYERLAHFGSLILSSSLSASQFSSLSSLGFELKWACSLWLNDNEQLAVSVSFWLNLDISLIISTDTLDVLSVCFLLNTVNTKVLLLAGILLILMCKDIRKDFSATSKYLLASTFLLWKHPTTDTWQWPCTCIYTLPNENFSKQIVLKSC